jgi:ubiquitin carboxyl-terminal hydrolase 4/11/15
LTPKHTQRTVDLTDGQPLIVEFSARTHALFYNAAAEAAPDDDDDDNGDAISLDSCLKLFTDVETLGLEDKWLCPMCRTAVRATKTMSIFNLPAVLIVHLKRFQQERLYRDKIDVGVKFPLRGLDMQVSLQITINKLESHVVCRLQ